MWLKRFVITTAGLLIGLLGVILLFKDLLLSKETNVLWADNMDPKLIYWIVNWGYHILFQQAQPLNFWNANSFYPNEMTLANSDSLLSAQLFFAPLRLLGVQPLSALYLTLAGFCLVGTCLTYYALGRIGSFSLVEKIFITFCAHFSLSMVSFFVHYQLFGFELAPPFFLLLYLYLVEFKFKTLILLLVVFGLAIGFAVYLAPMLLILSLILGIPFVLWQIRRLGVINLLKSVGLLSIGITILMLFMIYMVEIRPYVVVATHSPAQPYEETAIFSADILSIFNGISKFSLLYGPEEYKIWGAWEYAYFPGILLLLFSGLYFVLMMTAVVCKAMPGLSMRCIQLQKKDSRLDIGIILFMAILLFTTIVLSWGPFYKSNHSIRFPFYYLSQVIIGLRNIRAPGRFGMLIGLPLAIFTVASLRLVISEGKGQFILLVILGLIICESLVKFPVFPFEVDPKGIYRQVSAQFTPGTPLLELPVYKKENISTIQLALDQLVGSTIHWGEMIPGYGARTTQDYKHLINLDRKIQQFEIEPNRVVRFGKQYKIEYYLIHLDQYDPLLKRKWINLSHRVGIIIYEDEDTILMQGSLDGIIIE